MTLVRLLLLIAVAAVLIQLNDWRPLDRVIAAGTALLGLAYGWSWVSLRGIALTRRVASDRIQVGQTLVDQIRLRNKGLLAKLWLEVYDQSSLPGHSASRVVTVRGRGTTDWTASTVCVRRGRYQIGPIALRSGDPFGIFPRRQRMRGGIDVVVYPPNFDLTGFRLPASPVSGGPRADLRTQTPTPMVTGIRDYVHGDAFNRISWNASARLGRLMVKEFDVDPTSDLWIILDLDARYKTGGHVGGRAVNGSTPPIEAWLDSTEEYGVAIVSSLAHYALNQGRAVGLIASGAHHEVVQAEQSDRAYIKMLESLAVVRADGQRSLAEVLVAEKRRFTRNSGIVVVTSSTEPIWVDALALIAMGRVQASVVFIEGASFDAAMASDSRPVLERLVTNRIRTYIVNAGDRIADALRSPAA